MYYGNPGCALVFPHNRGNEIFFHLKIKTGVKHSHANRLRGNFLTTLATVGNTAGESKPKHLYLVTETALECVGQWLIMDMNLCCTFNNEIANCDKQPMRVFFLKCTRMAIMPIWAAEALLRENKKIQ